MLKRLVVSLAVWFVVALSAAPCLAQSAPGASNSPGDLPKVFLDCVSAYCDFSFLRTEISFVDFVRDRTDSDVHVLVTSESTGGGGDKYTLSFIGQKRFAGVDHLLHFVSSNTNTDDDTRRGLANVIKMGLMHYVADTAVASEIRITRQKSADASKQAAPAKDPWDYWFFRTSVSASTNGERATNSMYLSGSVGANRTTDAWKVDASAYVSYNRSRYTFDDGSEYVSISRSLSFSALTVKSLTPHWSAGSRESVSRSTYLNQRLAMRVMPAVEYNIYPYTESTRRQFTFNYAAGVVHYRYDVPTIFDKTSETLPMHSGVVAASFKQPWGSVYSSFEASQFLTDTSKNRLNVSGMVNVRIFKGLSVRLSGDVSRIRDQIGLPRGGATPEEILVRRLQLATSYSYYASFGLSYNFGSIHNNVVNSRFESGGGGYMMYY
jgi:hypothetical protein